MRHNKDQMYMNTTQNEEKLHMDAQVLLTAYRHAIRDGNTDDIIYDVLKFASTYMQASVAYIVEKTEKNNEIATYTWQQEDLELSKEKMGKLPKVPFSYEEIVRHDMIIVDDIRDLDQEKRDILEKNKTKSLAIIPLISNEDLLGYVRMDDCRQYRKWSTEIGWFLQEMSNIFGSLISRKNTERSLWYSFEILRTVINNVDYLVFISDLRTSKLMFVNDSMARGSGLTAKEMEGKTCREVMMMNGEHACDNCPRAVMLDENGEVIKRRYTWEYNNPADGKWYLVRANIIKWIDGRNVHLETATEITNQKNNEEKLKREAELDKMTGAYNRESGLQIIQNILDQKDINQRTSIVFIDLDNMKKTNDKFGHTVGDKMILLTLDIIRTNIRKSDVLFRWGGDEFVAIIRSNEKDANLIMKKIKKIMSKYNKLEVNVFEMGFSYGIAEIQSNKEQTLEGLIQEADNKMYNHKMNEKSKS